MTPHAQSLARKNDSVIDYPTPRGPMPDPFRPLATVTIDGIKVDVTRCDGGSSFDLWFDWSNPTYGRCRVPVVVPRHELRRLGEALTEVAAALEKRT